MLIPMLMLAAAPAPDCGAAQTQTAMTECAGRDASAADAALNAQYRVTLADMKKRDAFIDPKVDKQISYSAALLAAQRAWLAFRDAECRAEGMEMRGGSAQPKVVSGCIAKLTRARTAQLKQMLWQQ